ncbi:hypothetical protein DUHN55_43000 [Helicobacter pylori]
MLRGSSTRPGGRKRWAANGPLLTLPSDTLVLTGHGDDTTIGAEAPHVQEWLDRRH